MENKVVVGPTTTVPVAPSQRLPELKSPSLPLPEIKSEKFLRLLFAKASERGYTPTHLVNQCAKIEQLEKKYSKSFDPKEKKRFGAGLFGRGKKCKRIY